jgi:hypothetical protein
MSGIGSLKFFTDFVFDVKKIMYVCNDQIYMLCLNMLIISNRLK